MTAFTFCSSTNANTVDGEINTQEITQTKETDPAKIPAQKVETKRTPVNKPVVQKTDKKTITSLTKVDKDGLTWYTDLQLAHKESQKTGKPVLGFFTGSDWCGWCFKLHDNVLVKDEFVKWAEENVVLMEIDFPRRTQLEPELKAQNDNLQRIFQVSGFPTVWYFTTEENAETGQLNLTALGKTGYPRAPKGQEATAFISASEAILNK